MEWLTWTLWIIAGLFVFPVVLGSWIIYSVLLLRFSRNKWARRESMPTDGEYARLYGQAVAWRNQYLPVKKDVSVVNDRLRLYGEYYDFGSEKAVIVIPGRMEACVYSCQYAEPYRKAGWNVLTIDGRAHGRSDGHVNSLGYREYRDILAWARFLHEEMKVRQIVLHGICIGSSTAVFTASDSSCPGYITGIVVDGLYQRFRDSLINHMKKDHRPVFPFAYGTMFFTRLVSRADVVHDGPVYRVPRLEKPVLFLHSLEDRFSTPEKAQELFDLCPSEKKFIHWFEHGEHSRVRFNNPESYDRAILDYLEAIGS